jgi:myo-inositol-1(or 4)-monophosphatase
MHFDQSDVEVVINVARQAAELVRRMQEAGLRGVHSKSSAGDLVTEADVASEHLIRDALHHRYPDVGLWGEESNTMPHTDYFWLVDPIDGTTNYAFGLDYNAVNIALQRHKETLLGVTCQIHTGRVYYSLAGAGAFRREANGDEVRLHVNAVDELRRALVATGFPYHSGVSADNNTAEFARVTALSGSIRCLGAAALDLAHVASGALAAFWEGWLNAWDAAPGVLFVREAGGRVTDYGGQEWTIHSGSLVSSNGQPGIHDALLAAINDARAGLPESRLRKG